MEGCGCRKGERLFLVRANRQRKLGISGGVLRAELRVGLVEQDLYVIPNNGQVPKNKKRRGVAEISFSLKLYFKILKKAAL